MKPRITRRTLLAAVVIAAMVFPQGAQAQQLTGAVEGKIVDSSGGVLPGVTIELLNAATGIALTQVSRADGIYAFNAVKPGAYLLKAALQGFRGSSLRVDVALNRSVKADLTLAVGDLNEVVEVRDAPPAVDVVRTQVSTNIDARAIVELPNINRDITALVELAPGARSVQGTTSGGSQVVDLSGNYSLGNGTRRSQSTFYLDGSENMGSRRNQALQMPNPDTVQEIQVISSSASAEFGKEPGISVNAVTKSGTNTLHGTAFYATHNGSLNASTWAASRAGLPRPDDTQKWMGATIGGPIRKNRTFFFASYQRYQDNQAVTLDNARMPTPAMMNGDFSAIPGFSIRAIDPRTGQPIGNRIPSYLLNPVAAQLKTAYPTIDAYNNTLRYIWAFERNVHNNEALAKVDHRLNERHQIALSYMTTKGQQDRPDNVGGLENGVPGYGGTSLVDARQHTASLRHTWIKGSNVIIESRLAMGRLDSGRERTEKDKNLGSLGVPWPEVRTGAEKTMPSIFFSGGPTARGGQYSDTLQQNYRALSTLTWRHDRHNVKVGVEGQYQNFSRLLNYDNGQLFFTGAYSNTAGPVNGPWPTLSTPSGDNQFAYSWADFLLGRLSRVVATGVSDNDISQRSFFVFAQDEWRITDRLTLSPGLRYELYGTPTSTAILAGYVDGHRSIQFPNAPLGLAFNGDQGIPSGLSTPDRNNVAPRLGIAYDVFGNGKLALRAGAGIYYALPPLSITEELTTIVAAPTFTGNHAFLSDPWGTSRNNSGDTACQFAGCVAPSFSGDPSRRTFPPSNITGFSPDLETPYQFQYNISAAWEAAKGLALEGGYVGNRARHGLTTRDDNLALWAPGANDGNLNARRPNPVWRGINLITSDAKEAYDAAQFSATLKRAKAYARLTYTLQRTLTTGDDEGIEVGISNATASWTDNPRSIETEYAPVTPRQVVRGAFVYELPTLSGKTLNAIAGGWQVGGNFTWNDGERLNIILGRENNFDGFTPDRPDGTGDLEYVRTQNPNGTLSWVTRAGLTDPPVPSASNPYPFGTLPRNAVRGPSRFFADAVLMKNFRLNERFRFQLRADANNVFNHPIWSNPNLSLASTDFGLVRTKSGGGRVIQVQAKLIF